MSKTTLLLLFIVAYPADPQINHGSLGLVYFTDDKIIMVADSRSSIRDRPPTYDRCKIAAANNDLVFVSTGSTGNAGEGPLVPHWSNTGEMLRAYRTIRARFGSLRGRMDDVATEWAMTIRNNFAKLMLWDPSAVREAVQNGLLTAGFLGGPNSVGDRMELYAARITYRDGAIGGTINPVIACQLSNFCTAGRAEIVNEMYAVKTERAKAARAFDVVNIDDETAPQDYEIKRAIRLVNLTIKYQDKGPEGGDVGGSVDAVELDRDGTVRWYSRKPNCPESE